MDKVKRGIENVGGKIAGVVLNKVPMTAKKYEDAYYYGSRAGRMSNVDNKKRSSIKSLIVDENEDMSQDTVEQIVEKNV